MTAKARPRRLAHFRSLVDGFSEGVVEGRLRTQHLTSPPADAGALGPEAVQEAVDELRVHQEELAVADEEMHLQLEELAEANARVHAERDRYRALFDVAPDAYFVTDRIGAIRDANVEAVRMLGIEPRFLHGKPLAALVDAADTRTFREALTTLGSATTASVEIRFKPRHAEPRWHAVKGVNVEQNTAILWIARDVQAYHDRGAALASTNVKLGASVATRTQELERANRDTSELLERERHLRKQLEDERAATNRFLVMLSRDLRSPLNAVLGWTQLLRREKLDEGARDRGLATIERNANAQLRLVEELLDISRSVSGHVQLERVPVDLRDLVQRAVEGAGAEAAERGIELRTALVSERVVVAGDRRRLGQVLTNLLSNAVKFTPRGGTITVTLDHDDASARFEVADTGRGISAEMLPHVFAAFRHPSSDDPTAAYDGPGLGLYVARQLVDTHDGRLVAESEGIGAGSRFIVSLPLTSASFVRGTPSTEEPAFGRDGTLDGIRVLVLDDDEDSRELTAAVLRQRGAVVAVVADIDAALDALSASPPDVLVSDIAMPGRSGLELARELRARRGSVTAMIAVSGFTSPEEVESALDAGFDIHVAKPVEPQELVDAVRDAARLRAH